MFHKIWLVTRTAGNTSLRRKEHRDLANDILPLTVSPLYFSSPFSLQAMLGSAFIFRTNSSALVFIVFGKLSNISSPYEKQMFHKIWLVTRTAGDTSVRRKEHRDLENDRLRSALVMRCLRIHGFVFCKYTKSLACFFKRWETMLLHEHLIVTTETSASCTSFRICFIEENTI
jgi:hypothetical protein